MRNDLSGGCVSEKFCNWQIMDRGKRGYICSEKPGNYLQRAQDYCDRTLENFEECVIKRKVDEGQLANLCEFNSELSRQNARQAGRGNFVPMGGGDDDIFMEQLDNYDIL